MSRPISDKDYMECLPSDLYRRSYLRWRERMENSIDSIVQAMTMFPLVQVMEQFNLTPRDFCLLVKLGYFTEEEVARFGLEQVREMDVI